MTTMGWECPKCSTVWSPWTPICPACMPAKIKVITQGATPISDLNFNTRINNALKLENIHTIEELCAHSANNLMKFEGISRKTVADIRYALSFKGLHLKGDLPDDDKQGRRDGS